MLLESLWKKGVLITLYMEKLNQLKIELTILNCRLMMKLLRHARFQPFAINLRFLIGVAKFSSQLERMSDLTLNILKVLKHSKNIEAYRGLNLIEMHAKVNHMFELFLKTYYQEELSYAYLILTLDEEVNSFKTQVIEATKASLRASTIEERDLDNLEALFISQHLERIGDTIKNLAEIAIYIYNGVDIRHNFVED